MFDPYHRWLAIKPDQRPPTLYQLLGVAPDETDRAVIEEAALRQASHVRIYQTGQYAQQSTKILNEIGQARATLLNPEKRKEYDARLETLPAAPPPLPPPLPVSAERPRDEAEESFASVLRPPSRPSYRDMLLPALGYVAILLLGGVLAFRLGLAGPGAESPAEPLRASPPSEPRGTEARP